ncbi:MAG: S-layer homology domain-containing protein [Peptostreptococcaceae bacterium]|nr:S-layer homology domain-containing protein [Peptostreptococcaceae bacterium]
MKKKLFVFVLAGIMVMGLPAFAFAQESGDMTQDRTQSQTMTQLMDQTATESALQIHDREKLQERLCITDSAIVMQQDRLQIQDRGRLQFKDCENHWALNQVTSVWSYGLIQGYSDGNFWPNRNLSGTEGLLITTRLMNCLSGIDAGNITPGAVDWNGVPDWAQTQLQDRNALRLMTQMNYYQDAQMNRLHIAVMLAKGLDLEPVDVNAETELKFQDQKGIPTQDLGYVLALQRMGIINGYPDGTFRPYGNVTRAEFSAMMVTILELLK